MIEGGDFKNAGSATSALKRLLKKINMDPADMRRAIIAAFEAEMNVVIHARRGSMRAIINSDEVEVEVRDEGPGIPDIEQAMKEGYSTASPQARQLGYGAGLGLPNMKKNSNVFEISSTVGQGTRVLCTVYFKTQQSSEGARNSIRVMHAKCRQCLFCVRACATKALRVYAGKPEIIKDLCIDCGACIDICKSGAITVSETRGEMGSAENKLLLVPPPFLAQFSATIRPKRVLAALHRLGFLDVYLTEPWEDALRTAVIRYAVEEAKQLPLISPTCPAVVNLITLRFQPLIPLIAPFFSPIEAAKVQLNGQATVFVACCPAQMTVLGGESPPKNVEIVIPSAVRHVVQPVVMEEDPSNYPAEVAMGPHANDSDLKGILQVNGMAHVIGALEKMENGRLRDVRILEPYACECGCYGSSLLTEQPFVARYRSCRNPMKHEASAIAVRRTVPLSARTGMRLSADVSNAIVKLSEVEELTKNLPGKDCGLCGAPSCDALAEDVVMGRASRKACPYVLDEMEASP
jgi:anti-sigma regulatory factor (Ser/Thr protein kinase)